jgi:septal ring factor EnvC (AmiA/AmiB activator)
LYPEYYILRVEDFDDVAKDSLDEWIYFLKNNAIPMEFTAKGLSQARAALQYDDLSEEEKKEYVHHINQVLYESNVVADSKAEGLAEGEKERKKLQQALNKKDKALEEKNKALNEKNKALEEKDKALEDQKREIEDLKRRLDKK